MSARRDWALALLASIHAKLDTDRTGAWHAVRLSREEGRYLLEVCARALKGEKDPLSIGKGAGGQSKFAEGLAEAKQVHQRIGAGESLRAACEAVGKANHRDGGPRGAVEKNYAMHKARLIAVERIYAAHRGGPAASIDDFEAAFRKEDPRK